METKKIKINKALACKLDDSVKDIAKKLKENNERRIFVVDNEGNLKGIITTTDLVYKALTDGNKTLKAKDVMTENILSVDSNEDLDKALEIMNKLKSFVCPVAENGKLLGVISYHDLMSYVVSSLKE